MAPEPPNMVTVQNIGVARLPSLETPTGLSVMKPSGMGPTKRIEKNGGS